MAAYTAGLMTHVTCRLTAKNRDQLRNPTVGNRVWAAFTFYTVRVGHVATVGIAVADSVLRLCELRVRLVVSRECGPIGGPESVDNVAGRPRQVEQSTHADNSSQRQTRRRLYVYTFNICRSSHAFPQSFQEELEICQI